MPPHMVRRRQGWPRTRGWAFVVGRGRRVRSRGQGTAQRMVDGRAEHCAYLSARLPPWRAAAYAAAHGMDGKLTQCALRASAFLLLQAIEPATTARAASAALQDRRYVAAVLQWAHAAVERGEHVADGMKLAAGGLVPGLGCSGDSA